MKEIDINKYLIEHIPYSIRIMLGHYKFMQKYYPNIINDSTILETTFVGAISKGRMLLETIGVKLQTNALEIQEAPQKNSKGLDIWADDLEGNLVAVTNYKQENTEEYLWLKDYLISANKYELHLTQQDQFSRDLENYNNAIPIILSLVRENIYNTEHRKKIFDRTIKKCDYNLDY